MKVINLYGGPGSGKSTVAAGLFYLFRMDNRFNCELVTEFAKEVVFENARQNLADQVYLLGNQYHRLWRLQKAGVELVITDSPLDLANVYTEYRRGTHKTEIRDLIYSLNEELDNYYILIERPTTGKFLKTSQRALTLDKLIREHHIFDATFKYEPNVADEIFRWFEKIIH